jgi:hypothetical protein
MIRIRDVWWMDSSKYLNRRANLSWCFALSGNQLYSTVQTLYHHHYLLLLLSLLLLLLCHRVYSTFSRTRSRNVAK